MDLHLSLISFGSKKSYDIMLTFFRAFFKCVSSVSWWAGAGGDVVEDPALGVGATSAGIRVHTLVPCARRPS